MSTLEEAAAQVASLRAALSVGAAAEEALRGELDGLRAQLLAFQREEAARFASQLKGRAEEMRLRVALGEAAEAKARQGQAVAAAAADVTCLRVELERAEARAHDAHLELEASRDHARLQSTSLMAAREREGVEHRERLAGHQVQLEKLRHALHTSHRVDPRIFMDALEPGCRRLTESANSELALSAAVGQKWATTEVEAARAEAARAGARLTRAEQALQDESANRAARVSEAEEVRASLVSPIEYESTDACVGCC